MSYLPDGTRVEVPLTYQDSQRITFIRSPCLLSSIQELGLAYRSLEKVVRAAGGSVWEGDVAVVAVLAEAHPSLALVRSHRPLLTHIRSRLQEMAESNGLPCWLLRHADHLRVRRATIYDIVRFQPPCFIFRGMRKLSAGAPHPAPARRHRRLHGGRVEVASGSSGRRRLDGAVGG